MSTHRLRDVLVPTSARSVDVTNRNVDLSLHRIPAYSRQLVQVNALKPRLYRLH